MQTKIVIDLSTAPSQDVANIVWSPTSERVAVSFQGSELIALFGCQGDSYPRFYPIGYIRGPSSSSSDSVNRPHHLVFRPYFEAGALLTVTWTEGTITQYPMHFKHTQ
eukprot:TRINITY_DN5435_c0_g2_i2.p1 TRINITY_DN5435_c0_g2~~TRINITY_DN5435_c0_g2_i2.p1  ORF type:complete len:108 (-),score=24.88 TRINITY_DN5435_c0_g2_i2:20-343(-)